METDTAARPRPQSTARHSVQEALDFTDTHRADPDQLTVYDLPDRPETDQ